MESCQVGAGTNWNICAFYEKGTEEFKEYEEKLWPRIQNLKDNLQQFFQTTKREKKMKCWKVIKQNGIHFNTIESFAESHLLLPRKSLRFPNLSQ